MFLDGLEDAYDNGLLMGCFAETTANHFHFSREQQDEYAIQSMSKALKSIESDAFAEEIAPVTINTRKGDVTVTTDEGPDATKLAKIPQLKPAFKADGTVTAANSSSISDGAASLILMSAAQAQKRGLKSYCTHRGSCQSCPGTAMVYYSPC